MFLLKIIAGLFKALNGDAHPAQVASGAWLGCMLGLTPFVGAHNAILLLLVLIFRINLGSTMVFWAITKAIGIGLVPLVAVPLGQWLLADGSATRDIVVVLLTTPVLGLMQLEVHSVLGGMVLGFLVGGLICFPIVKGIVAYRAHVREGFKRSKTLKWLSRTWLFRLFRGVLEGI